MKMRALVVGAGALTLLGGAALAVGAARGGGETAPPSASQQVQHVVATPVRGGVGTGVPGRARPAKTSRSNGIDYHGGPVMTSGTNAYVIWYGDWSGNSATGILTDLLRDIGGSGYYNINTTYYDGAGRKVPNSVSFAGQTAVGYSRGSATLSDSDIAGIVTDAITNGLPADENGVYFVLTSADVKKTGFLTSYCGWHTHGTIAGKDIKYSFVGDPGTNAACSVQTSKSPNGNPGADAMASVIAHELEEAVTDPDLNAWYDRRGYENADKCAWTFGTTYTVANGSKANMRLGGRDFLIQRNWVNASGGFCALSY